MSISYPDEVITTLEQLLQTAIPSQVYSYEPSGVGMLSSAIVSNENTPSKPKIKRSVSDTNHNYGSKRAKMVATPNPVGCDKNDAEGVSHGPSHGAGSPLQQSAERASHGLERSSHGTSHGPEAPSQGAEIRARGQLSDLATTATPLSPPPSPTDTAADLPMNPPTPTHTGLPDLSHDILSCITGQPNSLDSLSVDASEPPTTLAALVSSILLRTPSIVSPAAHQFDFSTTPSASCTHFINLPVTASASQSTSASRSTSVVIPAPFSINPQPDSSSLATLMSPALLFQPSIAPQASVSLSTSHSTPTVPSTTHAGASVIGTLLCAISPSVVDPGEEYEATISIVPNPVATSTS